MTRISFDLDPRVIAKLRAAANRRQVTADVVANELLAAALRVSIPATVRTARHAADLDGPPRPVAVVYDTPYPDDEDHEAE